MTPTMTTGRQAVRNILSSTTSSSKRASSSSTVHPSHARRAPRRTLRSLVELHHKSAAFLPNTASTTIADGVENAFKSDAPLWQEYNNDDTAANPPFQAPFLMEVVTKQSLRGIGGIEEFRTYSLAGDRVGANIPRGNPKPYAVRPLRSAWTSTEMSSKADIKHAANMSEREARVEEALHGTWMGGWTREAGLEGVEEYAQATGQGVRKLAEKWMRRDAD